MVLFALFRSMLGQCLEIDLSHYHFIFFPISPHIGLTTQTPLRLATRREIESESISLNKIASAIAAQPVRYKRALVSVV
jgi:hypothetical protein